MLTDWLMVIITGVYVIATIFICSYNRKTMEAANLQVEEMKKQFKENNRPRIVPELVLINRTIYAIRFTNCGNSYAINFNFDVNKSFIETLENETLKNQIREDVKKKRNLGANCYYDLYLDLANGFKQKCKELLEIKITYKDLSNNLYIDEHEVNIKDYSVFYSTKTDYEILCEKLDCLSLISESLERMSNVKNIDCGNSGNSNDL